MTGVLSDHGLLMAADGQTQQQGTGGRALEAGDTAAVCLPSSQLAAPWPIEPFPHAVYASPRPLITVNHVLV